MMKGVNQEKGRQSSFLFVCHCLIVFFSIDHNKNRRTSTQRVKRSLARLRPGLLVRVIGEFFGVGTVIQRGEKDLKWELVTIDVDDNFLTFFHSKGGSKTKRSWVKNIHWIYKSS